MFKIQIESELHLELLHLIHTKELYEVVNANREHLKEWMWWVNATNKEEDIKNFIKSTMRQYSDDLGFQVAIFHMGNLVGVSGYLPINKKDHIGELGYWLSADSEGLEIMTKANMKIIGMGFELLNLNKVVIRCAVENRKSRAVAERLGFSQEGILRQNEWLNDHYVDNVLYSKLKSEHRIS